MQDITDLLDKARTLEASGKTARAVVLYRKVLKIDGRNLAAHEGLAGLFLAAGQARDALPHAEKITLLAPGHFPGWHNRGAIEQALGLHFECEMSFRKALSLNPDHPETLTSFAMAALRNGHLKEGFGAFEHRYATSRYREERVWPAPRWTGEDLGDGTLFLHADQGLGDTLQFVRFARQARARAGKVVLGCQEPLREVLQGVEGIDRILAPGEPMPPMTAHCALPSLPFALGVSAETGLGMQGPYLKVPTGPSPYPLVTGDRAIGLVWAGNPDHPNDRYRSLDPRLLKPLFTSLEARWISLQVGPDATAICRKFNLEDAGASLASFADTARLVSQLDLVITVDTSVAHLAGALGKPVWILLPKNSDWRWLTDRTDTPWYPSARLLRQKKLGDWPQVVTEAMTMLKNRRMVPSTKQM